MKWHSISQVAMVVNLSRQAVYKKLKRLSLEEKTNLGGNLIEDGQILLSEDGVKALFGVTTNDNQVVSQVVTTVNNEVVAGLQNQLSAKEKEVVRMGDILDKVLGQLEEERRMRGEERQRTDTILMKLTTDISTLQKCLEYKKPEVPPATTVFAASSTARKVDTSRRSAPPISLMAEKREPIQRELSFWESAQVSFNDCMGLLFGRG
ncbi:MAG: hypothetical protein WA705_26330 [Candidatus Ozemobacteraceae bacterium]